MDNDLVELVGKLTEQTNAGKFQWEDVSTHSGGDRFRLNFGDVVVTIQDGDRKQWTDEGEEYFAPLYRMQVLNNRGFVVVESELVSGEKSFDQLAELFQLARSSARNRRHVLSSLLERISR